MRLKRTSLLGLPISLSATSAETVEGIAQSLRSDRPTLVTFVNPHAFYLSSINQSYLNSLWHFDMVLPDGIGTVKALQWLHNQNVERQSFDTTSLYHPVLDLLDQGGFSLCLIGAKPGIAHLAQQKMEAKYPHVDYRGCLDGFCSFDEAVRWTIERRPDVVIVGMGAPRQEAYLLRLKQSGFTGLGMTCGGFLDQIAENETYYPKIVDALDMRWVYRLFKEPRRLARRYLIEYRGFVLSVLYRRASKALFDHDGIPIVWR